VSSPEGWMDGWMMDRRTEGGEDVWEIEGERLERLERVSGGLRWEGEEAGTSWGRSCNLASLEGWLALPALGYICTLCAFKYG
jgi:hypothetical protein